MSNQNGLNTPSPIGQSGSQIYAADVGATDAYAITLSPVPLAYTEGMEIRFKANTANTGAATLDVNGLGALTIKKEHDQDLATGDIEAGQIVTVIYDGTNLQMQSQLAQAPVNPYAVLQDGSPIYAADSVGTDAYAITLSPALGAYADGVVINFKAGTANTGAATLDVNGLGAIPINKLNDQALTTGDIEANQIVTVIYNSSGTPRFQMQSQPAQAQDNAYALLQDGSPIYAADSGAANAYVVTLSPVPSSYVAGMAVRFKATNANTTASTLDVNGLGAVAIKKAVSTDLAANDILAGQICTVIYDGTNFQLNPPPSTGTGSVTSVSGAAGLNVATPTTTPAISVLINQFCQGRITASSGVPVTSNNVTSVSTIYFTPYKGNYISLYTSGAWKLYTFTEISIAIPAAANTMYDVFIYDNAGTLTLELVAWTSISARATAIVFQDGVYCKSGALDRRYLGSVYAGAANTSEDSYTNRLIWNYYNRVRKGMSAIDSTDSWSYTTATYRQANANGSNQLNFVIGVTEDIVDAHVHGLALNASPVAIATGIGVNTTSTNNATQYGVTSLASANTICVVPAHIETFVAPGFNYMAWLEYSQAGGTTTWFGDNGLAAALQAGIYGNLFC